MQSIKNHNITRFLTIFLAGSLLSGCFLFDESDEDEYCAPQAPAVSPPAQAVRPPVPAPVAEEARAPNEGQLVQAGDLLMQLRRSRGVYPSLPEMRAYLQQHMGITAAQADRLIEELDV